MGPLTALWNASQAKASRSGKFAGRAPALRLMSIHRIVLEPGSADRHYWRDLWRYRSLFGFLAWRDILVRYKHTTIGVLWSVLWPLLTQAMLAFLGWLFESKLPGDVPRLLLVGAATLPWTFFSTAFSEAANSLIANSNLLTKRRRFLTM